MSRLKHHVLSCMFVTVIAILVAGCGFRTTGAEPTATPKVIRTTGAEPTATPGVSCPNWHLVSSPNPAASKSTLTSISALSATDAWAVGSSSPINGGQNPASSTLIEHWNGTHWSILSSPGPGPWGNNLLAVADLSTNDAWAVGDFINVQQSTGPTLIEHWDGAHWRVVSSPNIEFKSNILDGVTAISTKDIWAVGEAFDSGSGPSLIEHWDGQAWSIVSSPNAPTTDYSNLTAVTTLSANDIWAVGYSAVYGNNPSGGFASEPTLIEHWDGTAWNIVPSPNSPFKFNQLKSVVAVEANDIWAVGASFDSFYGSSHTLIEHWNGEKWSIVSSPNPESRSMTLSGITGASENDIWAVGTYANTSVDTNTRGPSLIEHWDGKQWSIISNPNIAVLGGLLGVTQVPQTNHLIAVGTDGSQTLTEFAC